MKTIQKNKEAAIYLTDGGLETDLIFNKGIDLPHFAAFPLLDDPKLSTILSNYYRDYIKLALANKTGFVLESPTWRANPDWGFTLGYSKQDLIRINQKAIAQLQELKAEYQNSLSHILISGCIGPREDGYTLNSIMTPEEAANYHQLQTEAFDRSDADLVSAITMTYIGEALGIAQAAKQQGIPVIISFTVETDGNLPSGESLEEAITRIDEITNNYPLYYMINCAHPSHFAKKLAANHSWKKRIHGIRANASCKSHAELDASTELDAGDKEALSQWYVTLRHYLPNLKVFGGCCGTDTTHIASICKHVLHHCQEV